MASIFDDDTRADLVRTLEASAIPEDADSAIRDEAWQYWFFQWISKDKAADDAAQTLVAIYYDVAAGERELGELYRAHLEDDRGIEWPQSLLTSISGVIDENGNGDDFDLRSDLSSEAVALLNERYYNDFVFDVSTRARETPMEGDSSTPTPQPQPQPQRQQLPVWATINVFVDGDNVRLIPMVTPDQLAQKIQDLGGPDLRADLESLRAQCATGVNPPEIDLLKWGGSELALLGFINRDYTEPHIELSIMGVFQPGDMVKENDYRLHLLAADGARCSYAQCGSVVMLEPGAGDIRYAVLRQACAQRTGLTGDSTVGTITRSNRRMRTDALRIKPITAGYKDDCKAAIREVSDKTVEWV